VSEQIPSDIVRRRDEIGDAISAVEMALAAAAGTGETWRAHVAETLQRLHGLVVDQVAAYEEPDGVFDDIVQRSPRLASRVAKIKERIEPLGARIDELVRLVHEADPDEVRDRAVLLLADIVRARQKIADLVWEACSVDLGGLSS
jgi:hypothetical protein